MARAPINGQTLTWARLVSRVDQAALAKAVGTTQAQIAKFEDETAQPTFRQLALLAAKLDRPLGFFFAPAPEKPDVPQTADFRGRDAGDDLPADIVREMKRAEQHRVAMLDLGRTPDWRWLHDTITFETVSTEAAALRQQFGLTERFTPPESAQNQVFNFWRGLLESYGFLVFQTTKIDLAAFRGLSLHHETLPIIVLNGSDSANGRVFTMFHEVSHLANRTNGLCVLNEDVYEEVIANRFAANFLMPESQVRRLIGRVEDAIDAAAAVSSTLKVSLLAAGVRLRSLGLIDETGLARVRMQSDETWRAAREAQKRSDGFVPPWRLRYRDLGSRYVGAVASALQDNRIDAVDATYLLNARWPMVEQMFQEYYRTGGDE